MRYDLRTEIDIDAEPHEVWWLLGDLGGYAEWNPFITSATGTAAVGERLTLRLEPPGGRSVTLRPTVTEATPGRTLAWLGRGGVPVIFDGRHRFELHPTATGTRMVHSEHFSGLLVRLLRRSLDGSTRAGFEAMNQALANRVAAMPAPAG